MPVYIISNSKDRHVNHCDVTGLIKQKKTQCVLLFNEFQ